MPLVTCVDCGREVSDAAPVCLGCGRPMGAQRTPTEPNMAAQRAHKAAFGGQKVSGTVGCLAIVGFVVIVGLVASKAPGCRTRSGADDNRTLIYKGERVRPAFKTCVLACFEPTAGVEPCPECSSSSLDEKCVHDVCAPRRVRECEAMCASKK